MRVAIRVDYTNMKTVVIGTPGEYDAVPQTDILLGGAPTVRHADRDVVAAAMLFNDQASGELLTEGNEGCSRHVAREIARFFAPVDLVVQPQSLAPIDVESGSATVVIPFQPFHESAQDSHSAPPLLLRFVLDGVGGMFSDREVVMGSNLPSSFDDADESLPDMLRHVGAALLFAGDLRVQRIRLHANWRSSQSQRRLEATRRLLSTIGISLDWPEG